MIHCVLVSGTVSGRSPGDELWAFIPPSQLAKTFLPVGRRRRLAVGGRRVHHRSDRQRHQPRVAHAARRARRQLRRRHARRARRDRPDEPHVPLGGGGHVHHGRQELRPRPRAGRGDLAGHDQLGRQVRLLRRHRQHHRQRAATASTSTRSTPATARSSGASTRPTPTTPRTTTCPAPSPSSTPRATAARSPRSTSAIIEGKVWSVNAIDGTGATAAFDAAATYLPANSINYPIESGLVLYHDPNTSHIDAIGVTGSADWVPSTTLSQGVQGRPLRVADHLDDADDARRGRARLRRADGRGQQRLLHHVARQPADGDRQLVHRDRQPHAHRARQHARR